MKFFGYTIADFIPCEICGAKSVDTHHISARSIKRSLEEDINNLMALCRDHHVKYGDKEYLRQYLIDMHKKFMKENGVNKC